MSAQLNFNPRDRRFVASQQRLADAFARKPGRSPIVEPGGCVRKYNFTERYGDFDKMLADAVGWANALAANGSDWLPFIDTFVDVVMVAEAFGCEVTCTPGSDPWCKHAVTSINDVYQIKPRPLQESPMIRRLAEWVDFAQRKLGTDLPLWTVDVQGPFSVAAHVVEPMELMMACVDNPPAVKHLLQMITDYSIEMMQAHIRQMEHPSFPGRNFPSIDANIGICIADDTPLVMLSPEMYREFSLPYNSQISRALGGSHIHSCGNYVHNLDNLLLIDGVRSIQLHAGEGEFPLPKTPQEDHPFNRARKTMTCLVDTNAVSWGDAWKGREREHYTDYILHRLCQADTTGVIFQGPGGSDPAEVARWTRQQVERYQHKQAQA